MLFIAQPMGLKAILVLFNLGIKRFQTLSIVNKRSKLFPVKENKNIDDDFEGKPFI